MAGSPMRAGALIAVVGPSGAGKDSLINAARELYRGDPRIGFVTRVITRPADGQTEDHAPATEAGFDRLDRDGRFAVSWYAHGLRYGIPAETRDEIAAGRVLIANGSRAALPALAEAYPSLAIIEITARPDVIAERLAGRGRESVEAIALRLARDAGDWRPDCPHLLIDNSGSLPESCERFFAAIESFLPPQSDTNPTSRHGSRPVS